MKIKKIDIPESTAIDASVLWGGINDKVLAAKINEVIDAVNELQINNLSPSSSAPLSMTNDYTVIKYDELCRLRDAADELARLKGLKSVLN